MKHSKSNLKTSRHRKNLENYLAKLVINGNVLDIGGAQKPVIGRLSKRSRLKTFHVLDLPNPHQMNSSKVDFFADIESDKFFGTGYQYDAIFCLEVSFYWINPIQALTNIVSMMNKQTILIINFHQIFANQKPNGKDSLRYSYDWIKSVFNELNLEIVHDFSTKLHPISQLFLKLIYKVERMRINHEYKYHFNSCNSIIAKQKL